MFDPELERFKRNIDLHSYAETLGYRVDLQESWGLRSPRSHYVMRDGRNDKITVTQNPANGEWIWTGRDGRGGSIVDFVQRHYSENLGHVRKRLRAWSGSAAPLTPWVPPAGPFKDRQSVLREYAAMKSGDALPYLVQERRIPASVLASDRFAGRVRVDGRGNAVFPHFDAAGLCGFEKKNRGFTGFAEGGTKGLWESHDSPDDRQLVIAESAIDALSHAALFPAPHARYRSTGGNPSPAQLGMIRAAVLDLPDDAEVIAATDNDPPGHALAATLGQLVHDALRPGLTFRVHAPPAEGADWNDVLKSNPLPVALTSLPCRP